MTRRSVIFTTATSLLAVATFGFAEPRNPKPAPLAQFAAAVGQYARLHRAVERQLPPLPIASNAQDIVESSNAMASALQKARAQAHEGDIFTAEIAAEFRTRISEALTARGFLPEEVVGASLEEADDEAPVPVVNGRFPWKRGAAMWPCVIDALPRLPDELQYRIIGRDLVLLDTHVDLVVDILRNAVR